MNDIHGKSLEEELVALGDAVEGLKHAVREAFLTDYAKCKKLVVKFYIWLKGGVR